MVINGSEDLHSHKGSNFQDMHCALCGPEAGHVVLYPARLDKLEMHEKKLFSARRIPGRVHFRIVICQRCGLVYSNPIYTEEMIKKLYAESEFIEDSFLQSQFENIKRDYAKQLHKAIAYTKNTDSLLDIGCGNGFFLKVAKENGFKNVRGLEPGRDAFNKADADIRHCIVTDYFRRGVFPDGSFDMVSAFHVLDHIFRPNDFLADVNSVLKPGGVVLLITHNVRFILTRIVGELAPMFHIEHIYLFDKSTIKKILINNGFEILRNEDLACTYTLAHAIKMIPMPLSVKEMILNNMRGKRIADWKVRLMPGDMVTIARKI